MEPRISAQCWKCCRKSFEWARPAHPSQPLTSGLWDIDFQNGRPIDKTQRIQFEQSDVLSFHNYNWPEDFEAACEVAGEIDPPIICTEYMARSVGSTFDTILPIAKESCGRH